ncbi:MAG: hypothetical protein WBZ00_06380, partial [Solirubrobacterales bacterium]
MSSIRKYTSPGLVLGVVAIVIALAGTSLAGDKTRTHPAGSVKQSIKTLPAVQQLSIPPQSTNEGKVEATVNCPSGYGQVVGGGATFASGTPLTVDARLIESGPNPQGHGWHVRYDNDQNTARSATVTA